MYVSRHVYMYIYTCDTNRHKMRGKEGKTKEIEKIHHKKNLSTIRYRGLHRGNG